MLYVLIIKWHGGLLFLFLIMNCQLSINGGGGGVFFSPILSNLLFYVNLPYISGKSLQATENPILYILYHKKKKSTRKKLLNYFKATTPNISGAVISFLI